MLRFLIAAAFIFAAGAAAAHHWYDPQCCSGEDCYPLPDDAVELLPSGHYLIKRTGEVFSAPNIRDGNRAALWSKDGQFHGCTSAGDRNAPHNFCLYVPRPAEG